MFDSNLLKILVPVLVEPDFFLALAIIFAHDFVKTLLEARFENSVVFVASLDNCFMMGSILDFDFACYLISFDFHI